MASPDRHMADEPPAYRPRIGTRRIIVHDSHTPHSMENAVLWLKTNGRTMGLLDVGYHYVIERDGRCICCRPHHVMGSHTPTCNHDSIGVCLAGGLDGKDDFTADQLFSLRALLAFLQSAYQWSLLITGHSDALRLKNHRRCPALELAPIIEDVMRDKLHKPSSRVVLDPTEVHAVGGTLSTQCKLLLKYMQSGRSLTNQVAIVNLGVGSLSSRIAELRKAGYDIRDSLKADFEERKYKSYYLHGAEKADATGEP